MTEEVRPSYPTAKWGKARKKPIVIEFREVEPNTNLNGLDRCEVIHTREGIIQGYPGKDYIIKGVRGEVYPIGKDIFEQTYDVIEEIQSSTQTAITEEP